MFKAMIIDDEPMIRQGIRTMVNWQAFECEVCSEASDGVDGLEKIQKFRPQIIITDIRMPEMDGLAMIREVRDLIPDSKIIILTGFRDYDYVYEALRMGAFGFILKPTKISELNSLISRAVTELNFQVDREEEMKKLRSVFERNMPVLREKLLYEMIHGIKESSDVEGRMRLFNIQLNRFVMLLIQCEAGEELKGISPYDRHVYQLGIIKSVEEIFQSEFQVLSISINDVDSAFILALPQTLNDVTSVISRKCQELQEMTDRCFGMTLTIAVSSKAQSGQEIRNKFKECNQALEYKHYAGSGSIIQYDDLHAFFRYDDFPDLKLIQQQLLDSVKAGNEESARKNLRELADCFNKDMLGRADWIKSYFISLMNNINDIRQSVLVVDNGGDGETTGHPDDPKRRLDNMKNPADLMDVLEEAALRATEHINRYNNRSIKLIIKKAMAYIHENYMNQISLDDVAAYVFVSPSYVSRMFGREAGQNFVDYLNEVRINKAKELLGDIRYKTYEIADRVGIQDARYFSRLFKKYTGMTPTDYRESL